MISSIQGIPLPGAQTALGGKPVTGAGSFQSILESAMSSVETSRQNAAQAIDAFLSGEGGELHTTILAAQKAELSLELFLQVRNKVVQAYQEIMRTQI